MSNCLVEASFQSAEANCSCVPGNLKISASQCHGPGLLCFRNVMNMIGQDLDFIFSKDLIALNRLEQHHTERWGKEAMSESLQRNEILRGHVPLLLSHSNNI